MDIQLTEEVNNLFLRKKCQKYSENHNQLERYTKYKVKDTTIANIKVTNKKMAKPFQNNAELS